MGEIKRVFSGIQPTGDIHIGNYVGAIGQWIKLLDDYDCFFCVVDYHSITIQYDPRKMPERVLNTVLVNMACGLDPEKCTLFVQSHVPQHTELCWIFNTVTPFGELGRMTQFKEKSEQQKANINAGLWDYPVLQAADILLYKASIVPVGEDQLQHIELARDIARRFNRQYSDVFPEPAGKVGQGARIMGLDGQSKMSKSLDNYIGILEDAETVKKKLSGAYTDPQRKRKNDPGRPWLCNIFTLHGVFSSEEECSGIDEDCKKAGIGCYDCKMKLALNMEKVLAPIRERAAELEQKKSWILESISAAAGKCRTIADETMDEVKSVMGLKGQDA